MCMAKYDFFCDTFFRYTPKMGKITSKMLIFQFLDRNPFKSLRNPLVFSPKNLKNSDRHGWV